MFISDGFAQVQHNVLTLVCEAGEFAQEIDLERVKQKEAEAREKLAGLDRLSKEALLAEASLKKAMAREMLARARVRHRRHQVVGGHRPAALPRRRANPSPEAAGRHGSRDVREVVDATVFAPRTSAVTRYEPPPLHASGHRRALLSSLTAVSLSGSRVLAGQGGIPDCENMQTTASGLQWGILKQGGDGRVTDDRRSRRSALHRLADGRHQVRQLP